MSNEEQMRAEFEAWAESQTDTYDPFDVWKAASAKRDEERDSLANMQDLAIEKLNQQVLELSAQVERMQKELRMMLEAGESEYGEDWFAAAMNGRQALSITPSSALASHDNEVAAKALEDAAEWFETSTYPNAKYAGTELRLMATERRNRK